MNVYNALMERVQRNAIGGIWPHSSANQFFIFCVGKSIVKSNAFMAYALHHGIGVKPLFGQYKGQTERSFIANLKNYDAIAPWLEAEESILLVGSSNNRGEPLATLKYLATGAEVPLGRLRQVSRDEALKQDSWTLCPLTKCYYVCS